MLPLTQSCPLSDIKPNIKQGFKSDSIYRKTHKLSLSLVLLALSFSTVGCATMQALEPTAILISDMKKIL